MRRKSVFSKWTLVLTVVLLCPYVYTRPQDAPPTSVSDSAHVDKPTEKPIRYRYRNDSISYRFKLPVLTNIYASQSEYAYSSTKNNLTKSLPESNKLLRDRINNSSDTNRRSRLLTKKIVSNNKNRKKNNAHLSLTNQSSQRVPLAENHKKTEIKRVITKWKDNTKYEDLDFTYETTLSNEIGKNRFTIVNTESSEEFSSTESNNDFSTEVSKKYGHRKPIKQLLNKIKNKINSRPKPQYSEEQVQSDNIYVTAGYPYPTTRPIYIFSTPKPTPIITNVGNPKPWSKPQNFQVVYHNPTTPRPVLVTKPLKDHHNYHNPVYNNYPQYPGHEFEVTTFQPANAYTDRIVIRPEEYAASPDECPTIFLTLNNTFQGQAKEACPDLNIAVNTNVVNKNVVVESEEEETDGIFSDPFEIPFGDESGDETGNSHDHSYDSEENQEQVESASIEGLALTNYNAASDGESAEPGGFGSPSSVLSSLSRPGHHHEDDDDTFSFSSIIQFFKPAINAIGWLATINPLSFGLFSLLLAPVVFLFAGTSGIAALFAPWAFSAREAPKIVHVHHPYWHWDNEIKTWQLHSFPHNRKWSLPRSSSESESTNLGSVKPTLFYKLKEWMKSTTHNLRQSHKSKIANVGHRKNKRKKRETWTIRIK